jgi:hypothetical protein
MNIGPNYVHRRSPSDYDCPNCDDSCCDLCKPVAKPAVSEPVPNQADLVTILTQCFHRDASVNDTAAAVRKLFESVPPAAEVPANELEAQYVKLAEADGRLGDLCSLNEYDPDKGRVPEHWQPRFRQFFAAAVNFGVARGLRAAAGAPVVPSVCTSGNQVSVTGHQLKQALALAWPDGDADPVQGFAVVTIGNMPAGPASNEDGMPVDRPAGLYLSFDDMPDQGMQQLHEEPDPRAQAQ